MPHVHSTRYRQQNSHHLTGELYTLPLVCQCHVHSTRYKQQNSHHLTGELYTLPLVCQCHMFILQDIDNRTAIISQANSTYWSGSSTCTSVWEIIHCLPLWGNLYSRRDRWPPFLFWIFKGDLTIQAYVWFGEILTMRYFLNGLPIIDLKFADLVPLWRHLYGLHDWWVVTLSFYYWFS